ncbi:M16 family metallopeptidase [Paludisphaera borealis]|uniref:Putative zinc protease n=1 Tax=Paludisphaera borealis TaxID=1387353 RepID=A0A1U7CX29_9BACT|nr:pitrilysin family protein [Paludisphaera borealis]APW63456.1 putative zinc protease [Paludisphaera borealis]
MIDSLKTQPFEFHKHTLGNGLDVIVKHQPRLPIVAINLWYHVGSKNEERNQRGYAHLFEHLMFEGSEHYPGDFFKHLQPLGASINGSTSSDRTNYFVDVPSAHAELVLAMESDRMAHLVPALDDNKLKIQKGVVKNEFRQNYANRPYGMVWQLLAEALYPPQHPYSWLTIGVMEDLDSASREDVAAFFQRYYTPANASLAIVGDLPIDEMTAMAERYFGSIPGGSKAIRPWTPPVGLGESRELTLQDRVELDRHYIVWHTVPQFHEHDAPLHLLGDVLARGRSSRLYKKLVIERQWAQDVSAYQSGRELAGTFGLTATLRPGWSIADVRGVLLDEVAEIAANGVTVEELERVVTMKSAGFLFALEHIGGFGGVADRLNAYNVYRGDPSLITTDLDRYTAVTPEAIRAAAAEYLVGKPSVSLSVVGRKTTVEVKALDRKTPPTSKAPAAFRAPKPEVHTLKNGLPVWVLPQHDLPTVSLSVAMTGGGGLQPSRRPGLAQLAVAMMDEGTRSRQAAEIALAAEEMGASLSTSCGWDGAFVSLRCLKAVLNQGLDLAVDVLREPTFPAAEWERLQGQTLAALKAEHDGADSRCYRAILKALYGEGHPYRHPLDGVESIVAELSREEAVDFHRRVLGPGRAAVIVAGDVTADSILPLLEARLGDWTGAAVDRPEIADPERVDHPRIILLNRPGAPQAVVRVGHVGIARSDPDFDRLMLLNQVLGGQFTSRLNEKLREERGFTYGVRSSFDCRLGKGPFSIAASLQSDRLAEALEDVHHEVQALVAGRPPTQAEIDDARRALVEGQTRQFETPSALVSRYAGVFIHGLPTDHLATFPERIAAVSLDDVIAAMHRQIHPSALVAVVVADLAQVHEPLKRLDWAEIEVVED